MPSAIRARASVVQKLIRQWAAAPARKVKLAARGK
jgi:hypothetical protein